MAKTRVKDGVRSEFGRDAQRSVLKRPLRVAAWPRHNDGSHDIFPNIPPGVEPPIPSTIVAPTSTGASLATMIAGPEGGCLGGAGGLAGRRWARLGRLLGARPGTPLHLVGGAARGSESSDTPVASISHESGLRRGLVASCNCRCVAAQRRSRPLLMTALTVAPLGRFYRAPARAAPAPERVDLSPRRATIAATRRDFGRRWTMLSRTALLVVPNIRSLLPRLPAGRSCNPSARGTAAPTEARHSGLHPYGARLPCDDTAYFLAFLRAGQLNAPSFP